jgi:hypothetical protein
MKNANPKMLDKLKDKFISLKDELVGLSKALPPVKPPVAAPAASPAQAPLSAAPAPAQAPIPAAQPVNTINYSTPKTQVPMVQTASGNIPEGASSSIENKFVASKPVSPRDAALAEKARQQKVKETMAVTASGKLTDSPRATGQFEPSTKFGRTASGKDIMHGFEDQHSNFSAEEHADAARQFMQARNTAKMDPTINPKTVQHFTDQATFHDKRMRELKASGNSPMKQRTYVAPKE